MSSYCGRAPALTIAMSRPARIAWYRNTAWIASRTRSLPRNANDTLDTPPLIRASGSSALRRRVASKNEIAYCACSSMPVAIAKMLGSRMISSGANPACSVSSR